MSAEQPISKTLITKLRQKALFRTACPEISVIQTSTGHQKIVSERVEKSFGFETINISILVSALAKVSLGLPLPYTLPYQQTMTQFLD